MARRGLLVSNAAVSNGCTRASILIEHLKRLLYKRRAGTALARCPALTTTRKDRAMGCNFSTLLAPAKASPACDIERWLPISGFPAYAISSQGRVMRIVMGGNGSKPGRILKSWDNQGYRQIDLCRDGKVHTLALHRIVCTAFHGNPPTPSHHAAHNDGDPSNSDADNLRWATGAQNEADKKLHGTTARGVTHGSRTKPWRVASGERNGKATKPEATVRGERVGGSKLTAADVVAIRLDTRSHRAIALDYGVSRQTVSSAISGDTWAHVPGTTGPARVALRMMAAQAGLAL